MSTNISFLFSWWFFLIMFCFLLNCRKNSNYFKIAVWRSESMKRNFGGFTFTNCRRSRRIWWIPQLLTALRFVNTAISLLLYTQRMIMMNRNMITWSKRVVGEEEYCQYGLSGFQGRHTKLDRFLTKNQHTYCVRDPTKKGHCTEVPWVLVRIWKLYNRIMSWRASKYQFSH